MRRYPLADRRRVLQFLQTHFPAEMERFRALVEEGNDLAVDFMSELVRLSLELLELKDRDAARFETMLRERQLERRAGSLARRLRRSETAADQKTLLQGELREVLNDAFQVTQSLMEADVRQMAEQLEELEDLVDRRQANREAIIEHRMDELTGRAENLRW